MDLLGPNRQGQIRRAITEINTPQRKRKPKQKTSEEVMEIEHESNSIKFLLDEGKRIIYEKAAERRRRGSMSGPVMRLDYYFVRETRQFCCADYTTTEGAKIVRMLNSTVGHIKPLPDGNTAQGHFWLQYVTVDSPAVMSEETDDDLSSKTIWIGVNVLDDTYNVGALGYDDFCEEEFDETSEAAAAEFEADLEEVFGAVTSHLRDGDLDVCEPVYSGTEDASGVPANADSEMETGLCLAFEPASN